MRTPTRMAADAVRRAGRPDHDAALDVRGARQLPVNTWTHLAATYDEQYAAPLRQRRRRSAATRSRGRSDVSTGALRIGGNSIWGEFFSGRIDEVRVYNRALTRARSRPT